MARSFGNNSANFFSVGDVAAIDITGTAFSIHCWVKLNSNTGNQGLVAKWSTGALQYALFALNNPNKVVVAVNGSAISTGATTISTGAWHAIGGLKNGNAAGGTVSFLDGASDGTGASGSVTDTASSLFLGKTGEAAPAPLDGLLAEVAIWDVALSPAEFAALAKGMCPLSFRRGNLKAYWPLFGASAPEVDLSGNLNNMALSGTVNGANHAPVGRLAI